MEGRLRKFAQIVESGSFTAAAVQLHISQPALTTAMQKLERELKTSLFASRKPPILLTNAGEAVYRYAKNLGVRTDNLKNELAELAGQKQSLRIGILDSLAQTLFSQTDLLSQIKSQANFSLTVNNSSTLLRQLKQGKLDATLVVEPADYLLGDDISFRPIGSEPMVAVARSTDMSSTPIQLLGYDEHSHTDRLIKDNFRSHRIDAIVTFRSTSQHVLLQLALAGEGVAVLPYDIAKEHIGDGSLHMVAGPIPRPIILVEHKESRKSPLFHLIIDPLQAQLQGLNDELSSLENAV